MGETSGDTLMADNEIVLRNGGQLSADTELYNRVEGRRFSKRVGFVGDLLLAMDRTQPPRAELRDDTRIIEALTSILASIRRDDLQHRYQAIIDSFQKYATHGMQDKLERIDYLCDEGAPAFQGAFEKEFDGFFTSKNSSVYSVKEKLASIVDAADAYMVVLSIGFHSLTIRCNETAHLDPVLLPKIDAAIQLLRQRLESTLLLGGKARWSLIGALLFSGDARFQKYRPYCSQYPGDDGLQRLVVSANEITPRDGYYEGHHVSAERPSPACILYADTLIELIARFEVLRKIRLGFEPGAASSPDPMATAELSGSANLAITASI